MATGTANLTVGIPREIKPGERRVAGLPVHVQELVDAGCRAVVEQGAGLGGRWADAEYADAGADLVATAAEVWDQADLVWKVKEILPEEFALLRSEQIVFTYLHAPPRPKMVSALRNVNGISIAYEEMVDELGRRPLLVPMSRMAGSGAIALAAQFCQTAHGGCGKLLFVTESTRPAQVAVLGGGVAGQAAARSALGAGAKVTIFEVDTARCEQLAKTFPTAEIVPSSEAAIGERLPETDVLVNCTYWMPGDPHIVTRDMLSLFREGSLIMDVSADPDGAVESSVATTHDDPIRVVDGILHYCVPNIPALYARSASEALSEATFPSLKALAVGGPDRAVRESALLRSGVVTWRGTVVGTELGEILSIETITPDELLKRLG